MKFILLLTLNLLSACFNQSKSDPSTNQTKIKKIQPRNDTVKKSFPERDSLTGTLTISVSYAAIACNCAQWFETKYINVPFLESVERFYLVPSNDKLINANTLWDGKHLPFMLKVTGSFAKKKEFRQINLLKGIPKRLGSFIMKKWMC